jgi:hypothetical protein
MNYYGFNGAGFWENETPETIQWVKELGTDLVVRFGGGSISRFYEPMSYSTGYGMTSESVARYFDKYGSTQQKDEDDGTEGAADWLRKVSEQPEYSYLDKIIQWQIDNPTNKIIWVSNILNSSISEQVNTIKYLVNNGVKIAAIEVGNEVYGKYLFDPALYLSTYEQLRTETLKIFPEAKFSLISGNFSGRKEHTNWNNKLNLYDKTKYDFITIHFYITEDKAPLSYSTLPSKSYTVDYTSVDTTLQVPFEHFINEVINTDYLQEEVDNAVLLYGKPIILSEFNSKPSYNFGNTIANAMWIYKQLIKLENVEYLLVHNGVSPDRYGIICRTQNVDDTTNSMARRTGYWALKFANETKNSNERYYWEFSQGDGIIIPYSGSFVDTFINHNTTDSVTITWDKAKIEPTSISIKYIKGDYIYSSAGSTGFQSKKQPKNFEIKNEETYNFEGNTGFITLVIPKYSLGYISSTFKNVYVPPIKPPKTKKKWWEWITDLF